MLNNTFFAISSYIVDPVHSIIVIEIIPGYFQLLPTSRYMQRALSTVRLTLFCTFIKLGNKSNYSTMSRNVVKIVESKEQGEGDGARVRRSIGRAEVYFLYN